MGDLRRFINFWGRSVNNALLRWGKTVADHAFALFGVLAICGVTFVWKPWREIGPNHHRPLAVPLLMLAAILLLSLYHGAYLTWKGEVATPAGQRDMAQALLAETHRTNEQLTTQVGTYQLQNSLRF